ncbi:MAG: acyl--CoA ligase [Nitrospirae bacterium]|nr:acyl--CoA ligase [Nitrospirota bacterium]
MSMNIYQTIKQETEDFENKTAVIDGERSISYSQLISSAELLAGSLKKAGVGPYDRVALLCKDSIEYIAASLAVLSLSAVMVPVAIEHTEEEINGILERIAVNYLVFEEGSYDDAGADKLGLINFFQKEFRLLNRGEQKEPDRAYYKINPAFIRFSSGTTGASKGVVLSHEAILERTSAADKGLRITQDDTVLWILSMSFHFVVTIMLFLRRAATIVLCSNLFPESLIDGISRHKGTFIYASPFHYNVLAHMETLSAEALQNIRLAVSTAMKLPEIIAQGFREKFGFELSEAYGIIEVGLPFINLSSDESKRSSVGKPLPDFEVEIVNRDREGVGPIYIKGEGMLDAYYSPWQNRECVLKNSWFDTGDLGRLDPDGFLTIVGRDKDVINFAGMKIFAQEVEAVINHFPGVRESYVYGEDHAIYGQLPMAKIVLQDGAGVSMDELKKFCYRKLAQYKVPKGFETVGSIPKTASGKIKR